MTKKWSDSDPQGVKFTRILERKDKPAEYDLGVVIDMMSKVGNSLLIKTNVALKTDWEKRLKYLEDTSIPKKTHEELNVR